MKIYKHRNLLKKSISLFVALLMMINITFVMPSTVLAKSKVCTITCEKIIEKIINVDNAEEFQITLKINTNGYHLKFHTIEDVIAEEVEIIPNSSSASLYKNGTLKGTYTNEDTVFTELPDKNKLIFEYPNNGNVDVIEISYKIKRAEGIEAGTYETSKSTVLKHQHDMGRWSKECVHVFQQESVIFSEDETEEKNHENLITINRTIKGNSKKIYPGKEFELEYSIQPQPILKSEVEGSINNKEIVLVVDTSGSMNWDVDGNETEDDSKRRISIIKNVLQNFITNFESKEYENVKIGLVEYNEKGSIVLGLKNAKQIMTFIKSNDFDAEGATNIGDGLRNAFYMLDEDNGADKYIILMTDGMPTAYTVKNGTFKHAYYQGKKVGFFKNKSEEMINFSFLKSNDSTDYVTEDLEDEDVTYIVNSGLKDFKNNSLKYAKKIGELIDRKGKIKTFVVGFGNGVDSNINKQIANSANGIYRNALDKDDIEKIYEEFAKVIKADLTGKVNFEEAFPCSDSRVSIEVINQLNEQYPKGKNTEWLTIEGEKIKGELKNINYKLNDAGTHYVADEIKFTVSLKVNKSCTIYKDSSSSVEYILNESMNEKKFFDELNIDVNTEKRAISSVTRVFPNKTVEPSSEYELVYNIDGDEMEYDIEKPLDIVLLLNTSATMKSYIQGNNEGDKNKGKLIDAAKSFIDNLPEGKDIRVGVVRYYYKGEVVSELQNISFREDKRELTELIEEKIQRNKSGTNLGDGLRRAYQLLSNESNREKHLVILSDGYANVGIKEQQLGRDWDNVPYILDLEESVNNKIENYEFKFLPLNDNGKSFMEGYSDKRFEIGHEYVIGIAKEISKSQMKINSHIIHFERVEGLGNNEGAMVNNNEVASVLGITKEIAHGQKFYVVENENKLIKVFETVGKAIQDTLVFKKVYYEEKFPAGVELIDYPNGLTKNGSIDTGYTLKGNISGVNMRKVSPNSNLYKVEGQFTVKIKLDSTGKYDFVNGNVKYIDPADYEDVVQVNSGSINVGNKKLGSINILEVQPEGKFELNKGMFKDLVTNENKNAVNLVQMSMDQFICDIEKINGKYDIVYVGNKNNKYTHIGDKVDDVQHGEGLYGQEYYSENDITNRKAKDLKEFIESGQLTIFSDRVFNNNKTKLYSNFKAYEGNKDNFVVTNKLSETMKQINQLYDECNKRPILILSKANSPKDYVSEDSNSTTYEESKVMHFIFDLENINAIGNNEMPMNVKLYLDKNGDGFFREDEMVKQGEPRLNGRGYSLDYRLRDNFTGMMPWKLEVEDVKTGAKTYKTGYPAYKGEKLIVRVLQLTPPENTLDISSDMSSLLETEHYHIEVTNLSINQFNQYYPKNVGSIKTKLNGNYDMIIFGFNDAYGFEDLTNQNAIKAIKDFIKTEQSVMFTHDTFTFNINQESGWGVNLTKEFRDISGQSRYKDTNNPTELDAFGKKIIHDKLPNSNNPYGFTAEVLERAESVNFNNYDRYESTFKLNDSVITKYPYVLPDTLPVAQTHFQYYQLNLEDEDVVPWYTLNDNGNKRYDGRNYYYTYSKGNITYSGTGHTSPNGIEEEKFFINTMIKASRSANHAPTLEVINLDENKIVSKAQDDFQFTFIADDIDGDPLSGKVYVNGILVKTYDSGDIQHNQPETVIITKGDLDAILGDDEEFTIKIIVEDSKGAVVEKSSTLKYFDNPVLNLNIDKEPKYLIGDEATIRLQATPHKTSDNLSTMIQNISFSMNYDNSAIESIDDTNWNLSDVIFDTDINPEAQEKTFKFRLNKVGNYNVDNTLKYGYSNIDVGNQTINFSYPISVRAGIIDVGVVNSDGTAFGSVKVEVTKHGRNPVYYDTDENGVLILENQPSGKYTIALKYLDDKYIGENLDRNISKTIELSYENYHEEVKLELIDSDKVGLDIVSQGGNQYLVGDTAQITLKAIAHNNDEKIETNIRNIEHSMSFDSNLLELTTADNNWDLNNVHVNGSSIGSNKEQTKVLNFKIKSKDEDGECEIINTLNYEYLDNIEKVTSSTHKFFVKSGKINVRVMQLNGRAFPNVPVIFTDMSRNIEIKKMTNSQGMCNVENIPSGTYTISIPLPEAFAPEADKSREVTLSYNESEHNIEFKINNNAQIINNGMYINNKFVDSNKVVRGFDAHLAAEFQVFHKQPKIRLILAKEINKVELELLRVDSSGNLTPVIGDLEVEEVKESHEDGNGIIVETTENLDINEGKVVLEKINDKKIRLRTLKIVIPQADEEYNFYLLKYTVSVPKQVKARTFLPYNIEVNNVKGSNQNPELEVFDMPTLD
ncbi:DUF5057 domain-containing protein [Oceanirhabdus sp. W0125-5]|uniref:DUF5057 domain-containing protein n=1 Tax=Oceanirhabdus sp. W0125-5 TaxID=2999116 RepID=UPI0022F30834|nr:DUF5057 domain-containing protein [Oceanirhabdus sp. W0125-5]WBW99592.1 DUF5057 domain-containing protein [Oceanirhabdus sp. W0125-5]